MGDIHPGIITAQLTSRRLGNKTHLQVQTRAIRGQNAKSCKNPNWIAPRCAPVNHFYLSGVEISLNLIQPHYASARWQYFKILLIWFFFIICFYFQHSRPCQLVSAIAFPLWTSLLQKWTANCHIQLWPSWGC